MSKRPALVARAGGPIGQAVCERLAERGHDVVVHFEQDDEAAQAAAQAVEDAGRSATLTAGRVGDAMVADSLAARVRRDQAVPRAMVVCPRRAPIAEDPGAAGDDREAFCSIDLGVVEPVLQADLKGPLALIQRFGEGMAEVGEGSIVVVGTGAALRSGPVGAPAQAAHEGVISLVRTAARALGPEVQVNAVTPGPLVPPGVDPEALDLDPADGSEGSDGWVRPGEVAGAVVHLLAAPPGLTGQVVDLGEDAGTGFQRRPWGEEGDAETDLPGIEKRVEPPDPEDRIDTDG